MPQMHDGEVLVFVEVRYRHSSAFGSPAETVDRRKQARLRAAASHYLVKHAIDRPCRFDVVAVSGGKAHIEWLRDAFDGVE